MEEKSNENIAAVILAAGGSSRFGKAKQLITWKGEPLIRHVVRIVSCSGLQPVILVLGNQADEIQAQVNDIPIQIEVNKDWRLGMSTSIKTGIAKIIHQCRACLFFLGDQPFISYNLIQKFIIKYEKTHAQIIVPRVNQSRTNPVLFDQNLFIELSQLTGDTGGRELFQHHAVEWLEYDDMRLLLDIDTPEDYKNAQTIS